MQFESFGRFGNQKYGLFVQGVKVFRDISQWDVSNVIYMNEMFEDSLFNGDISPWDTSLVREMTDMFSGSQFHGDISDGIPPK